MMVGRDDEQAQPVGNVLRQQRSKPPIPPGGERPAVGIRVRYAPDVAPPAPAPVAADADADADQAAAEAEAPYVVEVRDLAAERAGRVFPCLNAQHQYTGCIGFERCTVLCWSPRLRERQAVMRVYQPVNAPCRTCEYAREVYGQVARLNGREVPLMECRLGFWYGYTTVSDFVQSKIPLNVTLPCPGFSEVEAAHPVIQRVRLAARLRKK